MKTTILITSIALGLGAVAVNASPADDHGKALLGNAVASEETRMLANEKLSGDDLDERIPYVSSRSAATFVGDITPGQRAIANTFGVNAADYSNKDLVQMKIDQDL